MKLQVKLELYLEFNIFFVFVFAKLQKYKGEIMEDKIIELSKLSHALWKQKILYSRACELSEKAIIEDKYIPLLNEVLEEIKQVNKEFIKEKIKEL